jgi:hypothetical protein
MRSPSSDTRPRTARTSRRVTLATGLEVGDPHSWGMRKRRVGSDAERSAPDGWAHPSGIVAWVFSGSEDAVMGDCVHRVPPGPEGLAGAEGRDPLPAWGSVGGPTSLPV